MSAVSVRLAELVGEGLNFAQELKSFQSDAIDLILAGHHVVLNVRTGTGKTFPQIAANRLTLFILHSFLNILTKVMLDWNC